MRVQDLPSGPSSAASDSACWLPEFWGFSFAHGLRNERLSEP